METLPLFEFQHITKLSDGDLLTMLANGELKVTLGTVGELLINLTGVEAETIAKRSTRKTIPLSVENEELIQEVIASIITTNLQYVIKDAFSLALQWFESEQKTE